MKINPEEFYQPLFDSAGEGIILVDDAGLIIMANKRMMSLFGYDKDELIGQSIDVLVPNKSKKIHHQHFNSYIKTPKSMVMGKGRDLSGLKKNGTQFPVEVSLNYFNSNDKKYAISLITDITNRKKTENEIIELNEKLEQRVKERTIQLEKSEQLYRTIAQNFPDGTISVLDENLKYIFVEGKEFDKLGISNHNLIGTHYIHGIPEEIRGEVELNLARVFQGNATTFELYINGYAYQCDSVPLENNLHEVNQILVVQKNITQSKQIEKEMRKSLEKERELNNLKSRFVSMASHEFRTPLGVIQSSASLIDKYTKTEQQHNRSKHISKIKSSVKNLTRILNDFMSLDQLDVGKIHCVMKYYNINEVCESVIEYMHGLLKHGQHIIYQHHGSANMVYLDRQLIEKTLLNILSNASKYSHENQDISLMTHINSKSITIDILDNGIGIPKNEQKHLFKRFFRAHNALNIQGTGLGLHITKKYIDLMNGKISLWSNEEKGTQFSIEIPQNRIHE